MIILSLIALQSLTADGDKYKTLPHTDSDDDDDDDNDDVVDDDDDNVHQGGDDNKYDAGYDDLDNHWGERRTELKAVTF